jgi:hypothetical protein
MNEEQDILNSAPLLFSLEKKKVKAPEGYLENLESEVMKTVRPKGRIIPMVPNRFFYMAAGIALLIGLFWFSRPSELPPQQDIALETLVNEMSIEEIDYFVDMDESLIQEVYLETTETTTIPEIEYLIDDDVWSDELIIEYI